MSLPFTDTSALRCAGADILMAAGEIKQHETFHGPEHRRAFIDARLVAAAKDIAEFLNCDLVPRRKPDVVALESIKTLREAGIVPVVSDAPGFDGRAPVLACNEWPGDDDIVVLR